MIVSYCFSSFIVFWFQTRFHLYWNYKFHLLYQVCQYKQNFQEFLLINWLAPWNQHTSDRFSAVAQAPSVPWQSLRVSPPIVRSYHHLPPRFSQLKRWELMRTTFATWKHTPAVTRKFMQFCRFWSCAYISPKGMWVWSSTLPTGQWRMRVSQCLSTLSPMICSSHLKMDGWKTIVSFWDSYLAGTILGSGRVMRVIMRMMMMVALPQSTTFTTCWTRHSATTLAACWDHPSLQYLCDKYAGSRAWNTRRSIVCSRHISSYLGQILRKLIWNLSRWWDPVFALIQELW